MMSIKVLFRFFHIIKFCCCLGFHFRGYSDITLCENVSLKAPQCKKDRRVKMGKISQATGHRRRFFLTNIVGLATSEENGFYRMMDDQWTFERGKSIKIF